MRGEFEQYRAMGKRVEYLKRQLGQMICLTDTVMGSSAEYPYTQHPITICGRNAAEEEKIQQEIAELIRRREHVRGVVDEIKDQELKLMLELKYLDDVKRSWEDVAVEMQENVSGEALRKRADKFFDGLSGFS